MRVKTRFKQGFAESMCSKSRYEHLGVQQDFHEMSLKRPSSVKHPWASANGRVRLRSERNFSTAPIPLDDATPDEVCFAGVEQKEKWLH